MMTTVASALIDFPLRSSNARHAVVVGACSMARLVRLSKDSSPIRAILTNVEASGHFRRLGAQLRSPSNVAQPEVLPPEPRPRARRAAPFALLLAAVLLGGGLSWLVITGAGPASPEIVATHLNDVGDAGGMNGSLKNLISVWLLGLPLLLPLVWLAWLYNDMVDQEEQVYAAWAQVESNYQRRSDLIPGLVRAVNRYLSHERGTLVEVTAQRTAALDPLAAAVKDLDAAREEAEGPAAEAKPEAEALLERMAAAQEALGKSLGRFFGVAESYPQLRSADQFLELQAQLEGTENRINVARIEFNRQVERFNSAIRRLPGSLVAGLGHFRRKAYFQAAEGSVAAPELGLD
jgi:LemA protein